MAKHNFHYGWIIVIVSILLMIVSAGIQYSFGIFFKPLISSFEWSREITSVIYSLFLISFAISAIPVGWLADKFGPAKVAAICGMIAGFGLILTSNVTALWQIYLTYGIMVGIGLSGVYPIATATTARWFVKHRGLALGIVSAGYGIGTLALLPLAERLIATFDWSKTYLIFGSAALLFIITGALFLRRDPQDVGQYPYGFERTSAVLDGRNDEQEKRFPLRINLNLSAAIYTPALWLLMASYFFIYFCIDMVMVHLVNYSTDLGTVPLVAASLVSIIGASSIVGRLLMGSSADRIGSDNALIICCAIITISLIWLVYAKQLWMLYIFASTFGFACGGVVPQMPALTSKYFGLRAVTALVGAISMAAATGGAVSAWIAGLIFDFTHSYHIAFIMAVGVSILALIITLIMKKLKQVNN